MSNNHAQDNEDADGASGAHAPKDQQPESSAANEMAEHALWFKAQVEQAMREADCADTQWLTHAEVTAKWERQREALLRKIREGQP